MNRSDCLLNLGSVAVVIPALNEANAIAGLVSNVSQYGVPIVVDDGSDDETASLAKQAGAVVIKHDINRGYDAALESGLFKAIQFGFRYAITLDGDGQHSPQTLQLFITEFSNGADVVVGTRDKHQRFSEAIFSWVSRGLWGIRDPLCGMKGYKLDYLAKLGFFDSYSSIGTEFTIRCVRSGLRVASVLVPTRVRFDQSRFGSGFRPNLLILRALVIGLFKAKSFKL